jgi:hypothetical protein
MYANIHVRMGIFLPNTPVDGRSIRTPSSPIQDGTSLVLARLIVNCSCKNTAMLSSVVRTLGLASVALMGAANAYTLTVATTGGNASSSLLYGYMFEVVSLLPSLQCH